MNIQHSFSHTDLALELKDELEESLEEQQAFDGIKIQQERIGERGLQETVIEKATAKYLESGADFIVAFGGGSPMQSRFQYAYI